MLWLTRPRRLTQSRTARGPRTGREASCDDVAIALVYVGLLLVPTGLGVLVVPPVFTQAQHFVENAPRYAKAGTKYIERNRTRCDLQRKYDIGGQLQKKAGELPRRIGSAASVLADIGLGVVNSSPTWAARCQPDGLTAPRGSAE